MRTGSGAAPGVYAEPSRQIPVLGHPDVLVVGAGSAGIAAAVAAARAGADTWLLEASPFLGGLATVGLINLLLTLDDGAGTQVVAGLCQEVVERLDRAGQAVYPPPSRWNSEAREDIDQWRQWGLIWGAPEAVRYSVAFDPEAFIDVSIGMLRAANVRLRLHSWFAHVDVNDGRIDAVFVESKAGRQAIVPSVVIDATGDGDVFVAAGCPFEHVEIPPHLWFRMGGVGDDLRGSLAFRTTAPGRVLVPWGPHPDRVDACDPDSLTAALLACRDGARAEAERLRREAPGFAGAWLDDYARMLGITESRRLVGAQVVAKEDGDVRRADAVARTGHWTRRDVVFDIPYGALIHADVANLLVAGRCISVTRYVHQATKEIPAAMATGEAAGVAAALAAASDGDVRRIDVDRLRATLADAGAIV